MSSVSLRINQSDEELDLDFVYFKFIFLYFCSYSGVKCFRLFRKKKTLSDAHAYCRQLGAELFNIENRQSVGFLRISNITSPHLGSRRITSSIWAIANSKLFKSTTGYFIRLSFSNLKI